jgi:MFS superfamily sulfate permease-like transporter
MDYLWVAVAAVLPLLAALVVAWPFWIKRVADEMGAIVGALVVFTCVVFFIGREYSESDRAIAACLENQIRCRFSPSLFTRYAIYVAIGMTQVIVLFLVGLSVEEKLRQMANHEGTKSTKAG